MEQPHLDTLVSEQALKRLVRRHRDQKRNWRCSKGLQRPKVVKTSPAAQDARRRLLDQYQEIRKLRNDDERPQVRIGPSAHGPSACGTSLIRPSSIERWRRILSR